MTGKRERRESVKLFNGRITMNPPSDRTPYWRLSYKDPVTQKQRMTTGGRTQEEAEAKAAALLGYFAPESSVAADQAPTFSEVFESWISSNAHKWTSRTPVNYRYCALKYVIAIGDKQITAIRPIEISQVDISHLSRQQQMKTRRVIRGIFEHANSWARVDSKIYADAVKIAGHSDTDLKRQVDRGDIPHLSYVNNLILTTYNSWQNAFMLPDGLSFDSVTGEKTWAHTDRINVGFHHGHGDVIFRAGMPYEILKSHRRGQPKHYKYSESRERTETEKLASEYRMIGMIFALGAAGGLRIGEILALRVHHLMDATMRRSLIEYWDLDADPYVQMAESSWRGSIHVNEQASKASNGQMHITPPKMASVREVFVPPFMPARDFGAVDYASMSTDPWELPRDEAMSIWYRTGAVPVAMIMIDRLSEIMNRVMRMKVEEGWSLKETVNALGDSLLVHTRNPSRSKVYTPDRWYGTVAPDPVTKGGYMAADNLARIVNPLYDYVSEMMDHYPKHRVNNRTRNGWTHHGLRHFAVSARLRAGQPLPDIAEQMGHKNSAFTLERYGHVVTDHDSVRTFRF